MHSYIRNLLWLVMGYKVLILVLMEDALVLSTEVAQEFAIDVLILVLMEDALVHYIVETLLTMSNVS